MGGSNSKMTSRGGWRIQKDGAAREVYSKVVVWVG